MTVIAQASKSYLLPLIYNTYNNLKTGNDEGNIIFLALIVVLVFEDRRFSEK